MNPFVTEGFQRRGDCGDWPDLLVWLQNIGDLVLWSAFMVIPAILLFIAWKRKVDLRPFVWTFILFGAFTLLCGNTHFTGVLMWLWPAWWLDAYGKIVAGIVAWIAALNLFWTLPRILDHVSQQQISDAGSEIEEKFNAMVESIQDSNMRGDARLLKLRESIISLQKLSRKAERGDG